MGQPINRSDFLRRLGGLVALPLVACEGARGATEPLTEEDDLPPLYKPLTEWQNLLPPEQFSVLFEGGTEPAFSSPLHAEEREGTYVCAACFIPLFTSETKYETGTGWPSFWQPLEGRVLFKPDIRFSVPAVEYHCFRCYGHQGHVFGDGPQPSGNRYCNNGLAVLFVHRDEPLPGLRT